MRASRYIFTLDVQSLQSQICLAATQGDTYREFYINFSDGGVPFVLEQGTIASILIERPTGEVMEDFCEVVDGGINVSYRFKQSTCACDGLHNCQLLLTDEDGNQLHSPWFSMHVAKKKIVQT